MVQIQVQQVAVKDHPALQASLHACAWGAPYRYDVPHAGCADYLCYAST